MTPSRLTIRRIVPGNVRRPGRRAECECAGPAPFCLGRCTVLLASITAGLTRSCGCLRREWAATGRAARGLRKPGKAA